MCYGLQRPSWPRILVTCCHLICVESPEVELLLKQWTTHVGRVVQFAGAIVVEYLRKDARMTVEEILVEDRVVVGERLGETRQPGSRDLLERRFVRLVADTTHVDNDAIVGVRHGRHASERTAWSVLRGDRSREKEPQWKTEASSDTEPGGTREEHNTLNWSSSIQSNYRVPFSLYTTYTTELSFIIITHSTQQRLLHLYTVSQKTTLMLQAISSTHINRFCYFLADM